MAKRPSGRERVSILDLARRCDLKPEAVYDLIGEMMRELLDTKTVVWRGLGVFWIDVLPERQRMGRFLKDPEVKMRTWKSCRKLRFGVSFGLREALAGRPAYRGGKSAQDEVVQLEMGLENGK